MDLTTVQELIVASFVRMFTILDKRVYKRKREEERVRALLRVKEDLVVKAIVPKTHFETLSTDDEDKFAVEYNGFLLSIAELEILLMNADNSLAVIQNIKSVRHKVLSEYGERVNT